MNWKKYSIASACVCLFVFGIIKLVKACGGGYDSEYSRIFFFLPENSNITGSKWWLKQNEIYYYYDESETPNSIESEALPILYADYEALLKEWNTLLGNSFSNSDIEKAVFNSHYEAGNNIILDSLDRDDTSAKKAVQALNNEPDLLQYMIAAKLLENLPIGIASEDYEKSESDIENEQMVYAETAKNLETQLEQTKNNKPLAAKYLFQLAKMAASGMSVNHAEMYLHQLEELGQSKTLEGWARLYYAGLLLCGKERNVQLAKVLKDCPSKTNRCLELFRPTENTDYISQVSDSSTQACLWAMQAMHDYRPNAPYLENIVQLDPNNLLLTDLINREINKYEDYTFTSYLTGFSVFGNREKSGSYEASFDKLNELLLNSNIQRVTNPYLKEFYVLANAHLKALNNQTNEAVSLLEKLEPTSKAHQIQKNISLLFIHSNKAVYDESTLEKISKLIVDIAKLGSTNENTNRCISGVLLKMQKQFEQKGDMANAGLCFIRSNMGMVTNNFYTDYTWLELNANHAEYEKIEALLQKSNKTNFEELIVGGRDLLTIYDSHARVYLREKNLDKSLSYFQKLPDWYLAKNFGFTVETSVFFKADPHQNAHLNIIEALGQLNFKVKNVEKISEANKKATEYLAIASGFFELSNKGTYPYATAYYSTNYAPKSAKDITAKNPNSLYQFYFIAEPAFVYFDKAKALSADNELSAKISYFQLRAFDKVFESQYEYSTLPKENWIKHVKQFQNTEFYHYYPCPRIENFIKKERI